jgi:hypothetical protein
LEVEKPRDGFKWSTSEAASMSLLSHSGLSIAVPQAASLLKPREALPENPKKSQKAGSQNENCRGHSTKNSHGKNFLKLCDHRTFNP